MGMLKDSKVFRLEYNQAVDGVWTGWTDLTPDVRYSHTDLMTFQDSLQPADVIDLRWRGKMLEQFGSDTVTLRIPGDNVPEPPFVHLIVKHPATDPLPPVGWAGMLHQMGVQP